MVGNVQLIGGKFGRAIQLDGSGDYLEIPTFRGAYQAKQLSFSAWVNLNSTGSSNDSDDCTIFSTQGSSTNHSRLWFDINGDSIGNRTYSFTLGSPLALFNRTSGTDGLGIANKWQMVAATMNEDQRALYLDGRLVQQTSSPTSSITLEGTHARIGSWDDDSGADFTGLIDEVRIYGITLSSSDVKALWNSGAGDLGILPVVEMEEDVSTLEINGTIRFVQANNPVSVTGFEISDISVQGATIQSMTDDGSGGYSISLIPNLRGIPVTISIDSGSATGPDGTTSTGATSWRFSPSPPVTASENLVLRYEFEGNRTSKVFDLSPSLVDGFRMGGESLPGKFSQSLT